MPQNATGDLRARAWEMYLTGMPKSKIAVALALDRETVSRYIRGCYAEVAEERRMSLARMLDKALAVWRHVQEQAWDDHDADHERERRVLDIALSMAHVAQSSDAQDAKSCRSAPRVSMRFRSQRSQYLRIILDAEREIARLEGLYEGMASGESEVVFRVRKLE